MKIVRVFMPSPIILWVAVLILMGQSRLSSILFGNFETRMPEGSSKNQGLAQLNLFK